MMPEPNETNGDTEASGDTEANKAHEIDEAFMSSGASGIRLPVRGVLRPAHR